MLLATIEQIPAGDDESQARAHVTLGNIYIDQKQYEDALLAFMKVELVYPQYSDQRAEALARLAVLWKLVPNKRDDRASQAKEKLSNLFPASVWNR
ncbi:MAG: hypothetical protein QM811_28355 [Pirellulales bacterium]